MINPFCLPPGGPPDMGRGAPPPPAPRPGGLLGDRPPPASSYSDPIRMGGAPPVSSSGFNDPPRIAGPQRGGAPQYGQDRDMRTGKSQHRKQIFPP